MSDSPIIRDSLGRIVGSKGRPVGTTNHFSKTVKETVLAVFNDIQSDPKINLKSFAKKYPREFYAIASRLIPTEITGSIKQIINVTDKENAEEAEVVPDNPITEIHNTANE